MCNNYFHATQQLHIREGNWFPLWSQNKPCAIRCVVSAHLSAAGPGCDEDSLKEGFHPLQLNWCLTTSCPTALPQPSPDHKEWWCTAPTESKWWLQTHHDARINHFSASPTGLLSKATCPATIANEHKLAHLFATALSAANHSLAAKVQNMRTTILSARFLLANPLVSSLNSSSPHTSSLNLARPENCSFTGLLLLLFP